MRKGPWKSTPNAVYEINYHFVWSTKYRRSVLVPPIDETLKKVLAQTADEHGYEMLGMEVMPDHVHIFLSAPPAVSPAIIVKILKGTSARRLFTAHPPLKRQLWGGHLWNPSYYVGTAGHVSTETIKRYIEEQKTHADFDSPSESSRRSGDRTGPS
ncbi:IS200/IS605 family transposase [Kyrpidia spormannii]|uniref:Transposase n=1 Tax=Kyrpidia spormannii TaxID=2055160 RepID=A0ACA8ZAK8_9BACL|nr:IS200/IS605 family transposase [Kyrpidia spormannii]CAB3393263.1 transposase [Kyrpidia spormannii]